MARQHLAAPPEGAFSGRGFESLPFQQSDQRASDRSLTHRSHERRRLLGGDEPAELAELVQISKRLDADRLIDAANPHRCEAALPDELGDRIPSVLIVAGVEEQVGLGRELHLCAAEARGPQGARQRYDQQASGS